MRGGIYTDCSYPSDIEDFKMCFNFPLPLALYYIVFDFLQREDYICSGTWRIIYRDC